MLLLQIFLYVDPFKELSAPCRHFAGHACELVVCVCVQQRAHLNDSHRGQDQFNICYPIVVAEILFKRVGQATATIPYSEH